MGQTGRVRWPFRISVDSAIVALFQCFWMVPLSCSSGGGCEQKHAAPLSTHWSTCKTAGKVGAYSFSFVGWKRLENWPDDKVPLIKCWNLCTHTLYIFSIILFFINCQLAEWPSKAFATCKPHLLKFSQPVAFTGYKLCLANLHQLSCISAGR